MEKLRLYLRSVYLKGQQDANFKTCDMSWEDKIVKDITKLFNPMSKLRKKVEENENCIVCGKKSRKSF